MTQGAAAARRMMIMVMTTVLGVVGLAGCGKDEVAVAPSSSASSIPSPAPTSTPPPPEPSVPAVPTPPAKPATWMETDGAAAVDAAVYFTDLYNYALETGDLVEWRALSAAGCEFCDGVVGEIEAVYGEGGRVDGGAIQAVETTVVGADQGAYEVQHLFVADEYSLVAADGTVRETAEMSSAYMVFRLAPTGPGTDAGWRLQAGEVAVQPRPAIMIDGS